MDQSTSDAIARGETQAVRAAMWSVYYHSFYLTTLRRSLLEQPGPDRASPFGPIALARGLKILAEPFDEHDNHRRARVVRRLARAGFLDPERRSTLRREAAGNRAWLERIDELESALSPFLDAFAGDEHSERFVGPASRVEAALEEWVAAKTPTCQVLDPTCVACFNPFDDLTKRPVTTVTARAQVSRTPRQLAKMFDPRSWDACLDHFETKRKRPYDVGESDYPDYGNDIDPIGEPWPAGTEPHLFWERITVETENATNVFENILEIAEFIVADKQAKLSFQLKESRKLTIPGLGVDMTECVTRDRGYMLAEAITSKSGWSNVEIVKEVQFVDITKAGSNNPYGLEPGELLNYYAPVTMCLWLEDATEGAICCPT